MTHHTVLARLATPCRWVLAAASLLTVSTVGTADAAPVALAVPAPDTREADAAFDALLAARGDARLRALALAFLEEHGDTASASRRAIAHATLGGVAWRASSPGAKSGQCVDPVPFAHHPQACTASLREDLVPKPRAPKSAKDARAHLREVVRLAGAELPTNAEEARRFRDAVAQARVQLADSQLEAFLALEAPSELDFTGAPEAAAEEFREYYREMSAEGTELVSAYAEVKTAGSPRWSLVAAARTGLAMEISAEAINAIALPTGLDDAQRAAYCDALTPTIGSVRDQAQQVYAWCVEQADAQGIEGAAAETCRKRLEVLEDAG